MIRKLLTGMVLGAFAVSAGAHQYSLDKTHAEIYFKVRHLGLSKVKGEFKKFDAKVHYESLDDMSVAIMIEAASIDTGNTDRDDHLRNADFFDVEKYPSITFKSDTVKKGPDGPVLVGELTMKDVTKTVEFPVEVNGPIDSPWQEGTTIISITFDGTLLRHDYNVAKDGVSDKAIGSEVEFEVSFEAQHSE